MRESPTWWSRQPLPARRSTTCVRSRSFRRRRRPSSSGTPAKAAATTTSPTRAGCDPTLATIMARPNTATPACASAPRTTRRARACAVPRAVGAADTQYVRRQAVRAERSLSRRTFSRYEAVTAGHQAGNGLSAEVRRRRSAGLRGSDRSRSGASGARGPSVGPSSRPRERPVGALRRRRSAARDGREC